jgi:hypothetical protein
MLSLRFLPRQHACCLRSLWSVGRGLLLILLLWVCCLLQETTRTGAEGQLSLYEARFSEFADALKQNDKVLQQIQARGRGDIRRDANDGSDFQASLGIPLVGGGG